MITEDYISFEVAKLLKEKGFDANIITYRDDFIQHGNIVISLQECLSKDKIKTPTLQMAMKWLRDVHNIFIEINIIPHTTVTMEQEYYFFKSYKDRRPHNFPLNFSVKLYSSYEEACEAAIKYCLTNLI